VQIFIIQHLQEPEICPYPQPNKCSTQPFILHCLQTIKCVDVIHRFCPPPLSLWLFGNTWEPRSVLLGENAKLCIWFHRFVANQQDGMTFSFAPDDRE
jgi:hypothetical protein